MKKILVRTAIITLILALQGYTQEYLTLFKNSRLTVIPNAGHFIEMEQASELLRAIRAFL